MTTATDPTRADGARPPTPEPLCGCGHTVDRHCAHCDRCSGTLAELDLEPWEMDMPAGTVCLCTAYGPADR